MFFRFTVSFLTMIATTAFADCEPSLLAKSRQHYVAAFLVGNTQVPQTDTVIVLKMLARFLNDPIPRSLLLKDLSQTEIEQILDKAQRAHAAYSIPNVHVQAPEIIQLYRVQTRKVERILKQLIRIQFSTWSKAFVRFDSFYVFEKYPQKIDKARRLGDLLTTYFESTEFKQLAQKYREDIRLSIAQEEWSHGRELGRATVVMKFTQILENQLEAHAKLLAPELTGTLTEVLYLAQSGIRL